MTSATTNGASLAARVGGILVRQVRSAMDPIAARAAGPGHAASGWLAVTVLCEPSDIDETALPVPLAELADRIEVRVRPAPAGKGTELAARLREGSGSGTAPQRLSGSDPEADLRSALRQAKQLIEVGEVLAVDPAPHGERTPTPGGALLEAWTQAAPKGGVR
ncbi:MULTISPECIES: hypothetical protein [unclassified Nocardioides]|uniref:hypothetical protein n=1 Tax=unclassified Nocardioides TaxID=2615069 RepID=UPI0026658C22|nr:hypothetical protein [Nocardioides sp. Arc9.136]WKN46545.1 hypothetical protein OSR43_10820 [Nocardioides sp. Arc9.136]